MCLPEALGVTESTLKDQKLLSLWISLHFCYEYVSYSCSIDGPRNLYSEVGFTHQRCEHANTAASSVHVCLICACFRKEGGRCAVACVHIFTNTGVVAASMAADRKVASGGSTPPVPPPCTIPDHPVCKIKPKGKSLGSIKIIQVCMYCCRQISCTTR